MSTENTHFGAEGIEKMLDGCQSIFFIGIGGINMSSLAHISHLRGYRVGGSDRTRTSLTEKLASQGIEISYDHDAKNVEDYDAVVYTVAISPDNPEYVRAHERGIPCISRADYLGYIMTGYKNRIGVSGMHGKSTCTSMCATVFMQGGADPTVLSGAELDAMEGAYRIGQSENFIFEACEYMDSFLDFNPSTAIILNVEMDHVDYFHSMEQICDSYAKFASFTGKEGFVIANADNEYIPTVLEGYEGTVITFGVTNKHADYTAINIRYPEGFPEFDVMRRDEFFCHVKLSVTGEHNVYNALAACAAADLAKISPDDISAGLASLRAQSVVWNTRERSMARLCLTTTVIIRLRCSLPLRVSQSLNPNVSSASFSLIPILVPLLLWSNLQPPSTALTDCSSPISIPRVRPMISV